MLSAGYFEVTDEKLKTLSDADKRTFLREMVDYGGRISEHAYKLWMKKYGLA